MPKKPRKRRSRRTLFWAWPAHLECCLNGYRLVSLFPVKKNERMVRVRVTRL